MKSSFGTHGIFPTEEHQQQEQAQQAQAMQKLQSMAATAKDLGGAPPGVQEALLGPSSEMMGGAQQSQQMPQLVMPEEI